MKINGHVVEDERPTPAVGIDWLTAVIHINNDGVIQNISDVWLVIERIKHYAPSTAAFVFEQGVLPPVGIGRRPYLYSLSPRPSVLILVHPRRTDVVIELGGRACEAIREAGLELRILGEIAPYLSRLDVAVDIQTTVTPSEFVAAGFAARIKSSGQMKSPTGETVYVGSRSSETYARVYRYSSPHPRSHLLRVEAVFRHDRAKRIAESYLGEGHLNSAYSTISTRFGWMHQCWLPNDAEPLAFNRLKSDPSSAGKLRWIETQVIPTLRVLVRDDTLPLSRLIQLLTDP